MGTYRVETEDGSVYEVETEDSAPVDKHGAEMSAYNGPDPLAKEPKTKLQEARVQGFEWAKGLGKDFVDLALKPIWVAGPKEKVNAAMDIADRATRPVLNPIRRFFDPTNALGGSVMNLENNRPMVNDPEAAMFIDNISQMMAIPGMWEGIKTQLPENFLKFIGIGKNTELTVPNPAKPRSMTYGEAKTTVKDMPINRLQLSQDAANQRAVLQSEKMAGNESARVASQQNTQQTVAQMEEEKRRLQLARRNTQESLTKEQSNLAVQNRQGRNALVEQRQQAEINLADKGNQDAQAYASIAGERPNPIQFAKQSTEARKKALYTVQGQIRKTHNDILAIADRPENVTTTTTQRPTGLVDETGKAITQAVESKSSGAISSSAAKKALEEEFENLRGEIQIAINNGSPGARGLMQLYEGPEQYTLKQALDIRSSLNEIGYGGADSALTTRSQALARKTARILSESIKEQVGKFPNGGKDAIDLLNEESRLLKNRDAVFDSPAAWSTKRTMERYGDATRLNDPVSVKAWMDQVDDATVAGGKAQVTKDLLGEGPEKFTSKWKSMDNDVKALWYRPEEIAQGDRIANATPEGLKKIAKEYQDAENARIMKAVERGSSIRNRKSELNQLQTNIEELDSKIQTAKRSEVNNLRFQRMKIDLQYRAKSAQLRNEVSLKRQDLVRQMQQAQDKIDQVNKFKRVGWIALAAAVGSQASKVYRGFHAAMLGEP
jgi:hypothetical protein